MMDDDAGNGFSFLLYGVLERLSTGAPEHVSTLANSREIWGSLGEQLGLEALFGLGGDLDPLF
jgi:hypothetical protein